jgi:predicted transcriptional regulator
MDQSNNSQNNLNLLSEANYLVTKAVSTSSLPQQKVSSDLDQLEKAEKKTEYKANITKGVKNPQVYVAMSALRLSNPFKGY